MVRYLSDALPSVTMSTARVLVFGYDHILVATRSSVFRMSGYEAVETFTIAQASELAQSDLIDALVLCHTVPNGEKEHLVRAVRNRRTLMPILCVRAHQYDEIPIECVSVENSPVALLDAVRTAVRAYRSSKPGSIPLAS